MGWGEVGDQGDAGDKARGAGEGARGGIGVATEHMFNLTPKGADKDG